MAENYFDSETAKFDMPTCCHEDLGDRLKCPDLLVIPAESRKSSLRVVFNEFRSLTIELFTQGQYVNAADRVRIYKNTGCEVQEGPHLGPNGT